LKNGSLVIKSVKIRNDLYERLKTISKGEGVTLGEALESLLVSGDQRGDNQVTEGAVTAGNQVIRDMVTDALEKLKGSLILRTNVLLGFILPILDTFTDTLGDNEEQTEEEKAFEAGIMKLLDLIPRIFPERKYTDDKLRAFLSDGPLIE